MSEKTPSENLTDEGYVRFEAAWLSRRSDDPPPDWRVYLPAPEEPCSCALIVMLLKVDIECRVKAGLTALLGERYFEHLRLQQPDARLNAEQQIELIRWEYEQRGRNGQQVRPAEYEAAFPQHADAIRQLKPLSHSPQSDPILTQEESGQTSWYPIREGELPPLGISPPVVAEDKSPALDLRHYELIEQLGQGGMGEVYCCCDPALSRDLAIKVIKAEFCNHADVEQRFVREARITGSLQHPGIIAIHNLGRLADGRMFYTMRLLRDGRTFADILKEETGKPEHLPSLLAIFEKMCEAVAYAHSKRVIHRDLKPANIMVGKFGEVQVMDWGLAKLLTSTDELRDEEPRREAGGTLIHTEAQDTPSDLTQAGAGIGTPAYMPPEQAQGDWELVDERADVFALGAILCVMLTGQPPYRGGDADELLRRARLGDLAEALARLEQCGADTTLANLCRECLSVEPQRRPRDASIVARCVADYQLAVEARLRQAELERTEAEVKSLEERKRRRLAVMLSTAVLLVLAAGIVISSLFAIDAQHQAGLARENEQKADDNAKLEKLARRSAEDQKTRAENEKTRADQKAADARQQKQQAEAARDRVEWLLYVNQIRLAQHQWQDGNVQHARDLLDACRWDFRGWEYAYLRHLCDDTQQTFRGHTNHVFSVCFSPDGKRLASGSGDKTVKVWDAARGQEFLTLKGHTQSVSSVCFSPDGKRLASGGYDRTVKVWDVATGKEILTLNGHNSVVHSVCFSPDGKRLASASSDRTVKMWDASTGQELLTLIGHYHLVTSVCFSPDGKRLASGGYDQTVKVWDATTEQELDILKGHTSQFSSVGFSTDGKRIITQSLAGKPTDKPELRAWDAVTGAEIVLCTDPPPPPGQLRAVSSDSRMTLVVKGNTVEVRRRTRFTVDREERRKDEERKTLFWHQQQAQEAERYRQWFAAAFHLDWLLHNGPEQAALLVRRGWVRSQQGRMAEASADIHRALLLEPKNLYGLEWEARLCLASQDQPGYRRACAALQDALRSNSDWRWTIWLARTCSLAPDALADWQPLLQRIDKIDKALPKKDWWTSCSLGWVLIRAGRYNEAIPHLQQASKLRAKDFTSYEDLLLALAYHHLGKRDEALRYLRQAEQWRERGQAPVRAGAAVGVGRAGPLTLLSILHSEMADSRLASMSWEQRLELRLLYREVCKSLKPARP